MRILRACVLTCALCAPALPAASAAKKQAPEPTPTPAPTAPKKKLSGGIAAPGSASSSPAESPTPSPLGEGASIADAARRSREAREQKKPLLGVITNETLKKGASPSVAGTASTSRGTLSVAPVRPGEGQPAPVPTASPVTDLQGRTEKEWRDRVSVLKSRASSSEADVKRLEEETKRLENDFFAWSDGNYRDGVIKPAWDRSKAELRSAREGLDAANLEISDLEEEARKAGAPPGWLR